MSDNDLKNFVENICGESHLRVETDFGDGFVRLRSSEAERRQAAQDIRCSEDIVIELLRNSRDAGASTIYVALSREGSLRRLVVIDDGAGIPESMHERIFEPRVTSKLDTAHQDKWGMHGRGMAMYSIAVNSEDASVACSAPGMGCSIAIACNLEKLGEKSDQSTFPTFVLGENGAFAMRGPKNIIRTACEFALEHRNECKVYCGSPSEIALMLYLHGLKALSPAKAVFCSNPATLPLCSRLSAAADPAHFSQISFELGLPLSERTARRIIDGEEKPLPDLMTRMAAESFPPGSSEEPLCEARKVPRFEDERKLKLSDADKGALSQALASVVEDIAERYFLQPGEVRVRVANDALHITVPYEKLR